MLGPRLLRVHVQFRPGESISSVRRISEDLASDVGTASPDVHACGVKVARCGDRHACPITGHGVTEVVVCDPTVFANGRGVARAGDKAGCGATITTGCPTVEGGT